MRGVIVAIVLLVLVRDASADTVVIGTPGQIGAALFGANVGSALGAGVDFARNKGQFNAQIGGARRRFFAEYPKGRDFAQAEKEFAELLWSKDVYFMGFGLSDGNTQNMLGKLDAVTGGALDNGIPDEAKAAFGQWVSGIGASLGAKSRAPLANLSQSDLLAALDANKDAYAQYKRDRDEAEFEMQCVARPGPYCAPPPGGGYSHGGATERAARIADYYLAHYAQKLPGGAGVKTKLRDAIIKFESLAYTTQDCIRYVGRALENDPPRHDKNLAALRHAIAKYESVKVMPQEDICIRAVRDMQRAETGMTKPGMVNFGALPKEIWDYTFRTPKFNELYGPLTNDQARELLSQVSAGPRRRESRTSDQAPEPLPQARGRTVTDHALRVTIISFYTGSSEARDAQILSYIRVRDHVIQKASGLQSAARAPADTTLPKKRDPGPVPSASAAAPGATSVPSYHQALSAYSNRDYARARALFEQACNEGNSWGCSDLGIMISSGKGGAVDMARAREFFDKACKAGHAGACSMKDNPPPAVAKAPAVSADPTQKIYDEAVVASRSRDHTRARSLLEEACKGGNAKGCFELGSMFGTGTGGPLDQAQARVFYEQACTGGDARGCLNLGFLFSAGIGGPQDRERAESLYEQACKAGESSGCARLKSMQKRDKSRARP
jgi:TPR repeat protein